MTLAERLRAALQADPSHEIELLIGDTRDADMADGETLMRAAVLVPITDRPRPGVILTERSADLSRHAGQIAFPGGRIDPGDADATAAALREAEEELGIPASIVQVAGVADGYRTITGFDVTPVLGVIPPDLALAPNAGEVADWFEMPLDHLLDPANHSEASVEWLGRERHYYEIFWQDRRIWGATAAIVVNLARRLAWTR
ncbi:CoA pyrophosphatase [Sphingomonas gilva]|uniref:CoA pyrophosphatase n=1 Tax=Sphingomonas gilva TaxID=2305907 RepID=A0A396S3E6_9SPHN|nr:CoA pyrophosphatase [Sphingomonas gilva]RHW17915.1 CoA pyrophosphatase [Sphingomonas gilva]